MKIIAFSTWQCPQIFTVKSNREAKRLKNQLKNQQFLVEIKTEMEWKKENELD
jgi:hypothetical protein